MNDITMKYGQDSWSKRKRKLLGALPTEIYNKFEFTIAAQYSFTALCFGEKICELLINIGKDIGITSMSTITDTTAGVGGTAIAFSKYFNKVHAIEFDIKTHNMLQNNLTLLNITNVTVHLGYCQNYINSIKQDILFIDIWTCAEDYKNRRNIVMFLNYDNKSITSLEDMIIMGHKHAKLVVLKLPKNYDMEHLKKTIASVGDIIWAGAAPGRIIQIVVIRYI